MIETLADANILTMLDIKVIHAIKQTQILSCVQAKQKQTQKRKRYLIFAVFFFDFFSLSLPLSLCVNRSLHF